MVRPRLLPPTASRPERSLAGVHPYAVPRLRAVPSSRRLSRRISILVTPRTEPTSHNGRDTWEGAAQGGGRGVVGMSRDTERPEAPLPPRLWFALWPLWGLYGAGSLSKASRLATPLLSSGTSRSTAPPAVSSRGGGSHRRRPGTLAGITIEAGGKALVAPSNVYEHAFPGSAPSSRRGATRAFPPARAQTRLSGPRLGDEWGEPPSWGELA